MPKKIFFVSHVTYKSIPFRHDTQKQSKNKWFCSDPGFFW
jgi:hypothetical protein